MRSIPFFRHWQTSVIQAICSFLCCGGLGLAFINRQSDLASSFFAMSLVNLGTLGLLLFFRKKNTPTLSNTTYILNVVLVGFGVYNNQAFWIQNLPQSQIFFGYKAMSVIVALQGPIPSWVGFSLLSYLLALPMYQYFSWPESTHLAISAQEPWFTASLILACYFVYFQRIQILRVLEKNAELETTKKELKHFAEILLGVQHLLNSPLQIVESTTDILEIKHPETACLTKKIKQATLPIQKISRILSTSKSQLNWDDVTLLKDVDTLQLELEKLINREDLLKKTK